MKRDDKATELLESSYYAGNVKLMLTELEEDVWLYSACVPYLNAHMTSII